MFWSAPLSADLMTSPAAVAIDARKAPEDCATMADVRARFGAKAARRTLPAVSRQIAHAGNSPRALVDITGRLIDEAFGLRG